jgi:hypothetical protein
MKILDDKEKKRIAIKFINFRIFLIYFMSIHNLQLIKMETRNRLPIQELFTKIEHRYWPNRHVVLDDVIKLVTEMRLFTNHFLSFSLLIDLLFEKKWVGGCR